MPPLSVAAPSAPAGGDPRVQKLSPETVQKLIDAGKTPRSRELEGYQAFADGTAYAGRPHFFDDSVPVQQRAPLIVYRLAAIAAESNCSFAMGEGRFPVILSLSSESDDVFDKALGLSKADSATLDSFNSKLLDLTYLETIFGQAYKMAQAARSVAVVLGFRAGMPFADLVWSKLCEPEFNDPQDPFRCTKLVVRYRYTETWRDPVLTSGEWWTRVFEFLRVIDTVADTVYRPVAIWDVTDAGAVENVSPLKARTAHGFGLCPVHWYARNLKSLIGTTCDGEAIHDGLCGMIEQTDMALSQRHRAAIYAGDPQTVISGVSDDDPIGAMGQKAALNPLPGDLTAGGRQWQRAFGIATGSKGQALRRGVGEIWRIADPSGKAALLVLPADALDALDKDAKDLVQKLCDDMGITLLDPSAFSGGGDLSGRTLAFIFSKQINRVSQDRTDLERRLILPVLNLFYRMLLARSDGVYLPGLGKVLPILQRFNRSVAIDGGAPIAIWFSPQLQLKWGDYFEPSDLDESTRAATAITSYQANIITLQSAVEHVRAVFQIGSVDQYVVALKQQADEQQAKLHDAMVAMGGGGELNGGAGGGAGRAGAPKPGAPKPGAAKPGAAKPGAGGGGAAAARPKAKPARPARGTAAPV